MSVQIKWLQVRALLKKQLQEKKTPFIFNFSLGVRSVLVLEHDKLKYMSSKPQVWGWSTPICVRQEVNIQ